MDTNGFVKDAIAAVLFSVSTFVVHRAPLNIIISALAMGATVDGLFTLNPAWHCETWRFGSAPSLVILGQVLVFLYLLSQCK